MDPRLPLIACLVALSFPGCISDDPTPTTPAHATDAPSIDTNTRLMLEGQGWVRYELRAPPGESIRVTMQAPEKYDLCEGFRSDAYDLESDHLVGFATYVNDPNQEVDWYLFRSAGTGRPESTGTLSCGTAIIKPDADDRAFLVIANNMPDMTIQITMDDGSDITTAASLRPHPELMVIEAEGTRTATLDGAVYADMQEHWEVTTEGGPRIVQATHWHRTSSDSLIAYRDLQQQSFALMGIEEPFERRSTQYSHQSGTGIPASDETGSIGGSIEASGVAHGTEPVVATSERDTAAGYAVGNREAGLTLWQIPLVPVA